MKTIDAYPLSWPAHWPRTARPEPSRFGVTFAVARDHLLDELARLGATDIVLSSNVELRRDGLPYANRPEPDDPGVAVYFRLNGENRCIPVDRWDRVKDNLRAAGLTVAALRGLDRWGANQIVDAAFRGFAALPAGGTTETSAWWEVLGVARDASPATVRAAYRELVKRHHPDRGGVAETFHAIQMAWEQAQEAGRA